MGFGFRPPSSGHTSASFVIAIFAFHRRDYGPEREFPTLPDATFNAFLAVRSLERTGSALMRHERARCWLLSERNC